MRWPLKTLVLLVGFLFVSSSAKGQSSQLGGPALDPLPKGALVRMGSTRWRLGSKRWGPVSMHSSILSPNGKSVFVGSNEGIREFDLDSGLLVRTLQGHDEGIQALAVSPDGKLLVSGGYKGTFLWEVSTGKQLRVLKVNSVAVMRFSPDGKKLITGGGDHETSVRILDLASGKEDLRLLWHKRGVSFIGCAPDGKTLVTASDIDREIHVTDLTSGEIIRTLKIGQAMDTAITLSPDGKTLAVTSSRYRQTQPRWSQVVKLIDLTTGNEGSLLEDLQDGEPFQGGIGVIFSPDGKFVVASIGKSFHIWDLSNALAYRKFPGGGRRLFFTPDGRQLVVTDGVIRVWDFVGGKELHPPERPISVADSVAFSPDGKTLASSSYVGREPIQLWDAATGQPKGELQGHESAISGVEFAPNGRLVSGGGDGTLRVWDIDTAKEVYCFKMYEARAGEEKLQVVSMKVAVDGKRLAAAGDGISIGLPGGEKSHQFLWDLENGKLLAHHEKTGTYETYGEWPGFSHDCASVMERVETGLILKNFITGKETLKLQPIPQPKADKTVVHPDILEQPFTFSLDGRFVAVNSRRHHNDGPRHWSDNYSIVLFDLATGKELHRLPVDNWMARATFSPDSKRLAAAERQSVRIWDVADGKPLWQTPNLEFRVNALGFSADGDRLVTALDNGTMLIWDVNSPLKK